ncbi:hypothetical protein [Nakamurella deserti]|uniref:hypothetical protein n=1 Tax=Nakamurella deserti TaxID=2164074 RepID=UPI000DBE9F41|nr:hypothetical protein [Nakamurella deserti]
MPVAALVPPSPVTVAPSPALVAPSPVTVAPSAVAVEILLLALRELAALQRSDPQRSGRLRLELCRARRAHHRGRQGALAEQGFTAAVTAIVLAARGPGDAG